MNRLAKFLNNKKKENIMRTDFDTKISVYPIHEHSVTDLINELSIPEEVTEMEEVKEVQEPQSEKERQMLDQLVDKILES